MVFEDFSTVSVLILTYHLCIYLNHENASFYNKKFSPPPDFLREHVTMEIILYIYYGQIKVVIVTLKKYRGIRCATVAVDGLLIMNRKLQQAFW